MPTPSRHADATVLCITNTREDIDRAETGLLDALTKFGYPEASRFAVRLALEECLVNAFRHGHKALPPTTPVTFSYQVSADRLVMEIEDQGPGFNPDLVRDPTLDENLELPSGRGLLLMRAYMTSIEYLGRGNHVRMVYSPKPVK